MVSASTALVTISLVLLLLLVLPQVREGAARSAPRPRLRHGAGGCLRCAPGWGAVEPCGPAGDTRCARCAAGRAYSPHHSAHAPCWLCSRCGPGLFEARACSPRHDTVCDSCRRLLERHASLAAAPPADFYRKCLPADDGGGDAQRVGRSPP